MKNEIILRFNDVLTVRLGVRVFSGGEVNIQLPRQKYPPCVSKVEIVVQIQDSDGVMALLQTADMLRRRFGSDIKILLDMAYIPYARQDRVCNEGESLSSKIFCDLINGCDFSEVTVHDPHSDVSPAMLNNCKVVDMADILMMAGDLPSKIIKGEYILVAPDFGATKKVQKVAKQFSQETIVQGIKHRNLKTQELTGFGYTGDVEGKDLLILDDICDGGGTFVGLAEKLREGGAKSVSLYVTHGLFSRGIRNVLNNGIDEIFTTNSLPQVDQNNSNLTIIEL